MAEQEHGGAGGQSPLDSTPGTRVDNGDENTALHQPFFSMCQPLRSVSFSNSWEGVCVPDANENDNNSGLKSLEDEHVLIASTSLDEIDVPPEERNEHAEPLSTEQHNSIDEVELWDVKDNQQWSSRNKQPYNSNLGEICDAEAKQFPLSFSYRRQPQSVGAGLSNMGNTCLLNATLQCITHTVLLLIKLRSTNHSSPCPYNKDGFCSFCALKNMLMNQFECLDLL